MAREFTATESLEHNKCFEEACRLVEGELHVDADPIKGLPDAQTANKLRRAASLFERTLEINPENNASLFFLARIRLRFGDKEGNLSYLLRAEQVDPLSPGIARESILAALHLGQLDRALSIAKSAMARMPEDPGILVNLGLVLLFSGRPLEAESAFRTASSLEPANPYNAKLAFLSQLVATGKVPPPRTERAVAIALKSLPTTPP